MVRFRYVGIDPTHVNADIDPKYAMNMTEVCPPRNVLVGPAQKPARRTARKPIGVLSSLDLVSSAPDYPRDSGARDLRLFQLPPPPSKPRTVSRTGEYPLRGDARCATAA